MHDEPFSNPIAPPDKLSVRKTGQLSNDDFRTLLMTPRSVATTEDKKATDTKSSSGSKSTKPNKEHKPRRSSANNEWLAKLRKEEDERIAEWSKNYRDRAKERRDGMTGPLPVPDETLPTTSGYRAVAPNADPYKIAEERKKAIANSKYLGGDMEHTHLVKGLDYALLQKVRSEIKSKDVEKEELKKLHIKREKERQEKMQVTTKKEDSTVNSKLAKNIVNVLFQAKPPERNELFTPGRMAYVFELDDEYAESDIPMTLIRSKADCSANEHQTTLTTNDIVINKLTQILSYLRQGTKDTKRSKKKDKPVDEVKAVEKSSQPPKMEESIFPDVGEYDFTATKATSAGATSSGRPKKYFEKDKDDAMEVEMKNKKNNDYVVRLDVLTDKDIHKAAKEFVKSVGKKYSNVKVIGPPPDDSSGQLPAGWFAGEVDTSAKKSTVDSTSGLYEVVSSSKKDKVGFGGFDDDHYAECYPGGLEEMDATVNSDDEADFTKMDLGNRKGPVKRWDFDTEEDYGHYQSSREALPKAAFQYGVKMNDGRKTRRQGVKNDKAKLNREWQQISQILQKRKSKDLESATKKMKSD